MQLLFRCGLLNSSFQRISRLCTAADSNQDALKLISAGLYKLGSMRYMAEKTSTNVYSHFRDPCSQAPSMAEPPPTVLGERAFSGHLEDFHHLHQIVINFGSPEVADQMSGNVYMHASVVEDECSKCIRLVEQIGEFSINDLKEAITCLTWWGSDAQHSMALRDVVEALDRVSVDRLLSLHFSLEPQWKLYGAEFPLEDQLRLAFQLRSLAIDLPLQFPTKMLHSASPYIMQSSFPLIISFLLLLSAEPHSSPLGATVSGSKVAQRVTPILDLMGESEVAAACRGLRRLEGGKEGAEILSAWLTHKWGYRL